jgi:hypothetical protein
MTQCSSARVRCDTMIWAWIGLLYLRIVKVRTLIPRRHIALNVTTITVLWCNGRYCFDLTAIVRIRNPHRSTQAKLSNSRQRVYVWTISASASIWPVMTRVNQWPWTSLNDRSLEPISIRLGYLFHHMDFTKAAFNGCLQLQHLQR